jgi:hypothetical protein
MTMVLVGCSSGKIEEGPETVADELPHEEFDTVMPGETSPKFETFGPDSQDPNDVEVLTLEVIARTEEGNNLYIDYDFKLGEATWWEGGGY